MDEEETVLLSFSFSWIRDWATGAGRVSSGTSGGSGISKDTADQKKTKWKKIRGATFNLKHFL